MDDCWADIGVVLDSDLKQRIVLDRKSGLFNFVEPDLSCNAGFTTQLMGASYLWFRATDSVAQSVAKELAISATGLQLSSGGAIQPYNASTEEAPLVDVVEFAAVAGNLAYLARETGELVLRESLISGSNHLLQARVDGVPGAVLKNRRSTSHDVINASAYAANAWAHAFEQTQDEVYLDAMIKSVSHVMDRWAASDQGWWNYAETWDHQIVLGRSVSYQASILALICEVEGLLPDDVSEMWRDIRVAADVSLVDALCAKRDGDFEAPSWSRDWSNVFEIDWFLTRFSELDAGKELSRLRLRALARDMNTGSRRWHTRHSNVGNARRTFVSTDFRKIANLAGSFTRSLAALQI